MLQLIRHMPHLSTVRPIFRPPSSSACHAQPALALTPHFVGSLQGGRPVCTPLLLLLGCAALRVRGLQSHFTNRDLPHAVGLPTSNAHSLHKQEPVPGPEVVHQPLREAGLGGGDQHVVGHANGKRLGRQKLKVQQEVQVALAHNVHILGG